MSVTQTWQLAQLNIAHLRAPLDAPELKGFVDSLEPINALADSAKGFVWRLQTEEGDATGIDAFGDEVIVNLSVWRDAESLRNFVYHTAHADVMRRRKQWFDRMREAYLVLWWVPAGVVPDIEEAKQRLGLLRKNGAGPDAFDFRHFHAAPDGGED